MRRTVVAVIPPSFRDVWKEWDLRLTVVLSLVLQIIVILLGHRRKYKRSPLTSIILWSAYVAADSTAIFALGIVSNNLIDIYYKQDKPSILDANTQLTAFWAPFLLLHLGGPDTITAYSLEDNELWLRHLAGLAVQTVITIYVAVLTWTVSWLSILFILMFFAGFIEYGERNYTLRSASNDRLRETLFTPAQLLPKSWYRKKEETEENFGVHYSPIASASTSITSFPNTDKLSKASAVLDVTKRLFLDIILSYTERDRIKSVLENISTSEQAFEVVETEIGLIYDMLYTKAPLICTPWGLALRGITFFVICLVLAGFAILVLIVDRENKYSKIDVTITFLLLIVAVILDVYSALLLLFLDQFYIWLSKHNTANYILRVLASFPQSNKRWSHQMSHWSLLSSSIGKNPLPCRIIREVPKIGKMHKKRSHVAFEVPTDIKEWLFDRIKEIASEYVEGSMDQLIMKKSFIIIPTAQGKTLRGKWDITPPLDKEFGKSILFWHRKAFSFGT